MWFRSSFIHSSSIHSMFTEHLVLPSSDRNVKLEMVPAFMDVTVGWRMWTVNCSHGVTRHYSEEGHASCCGSREVASSVPRGVFRKASPLRREE